MELMASAATESLSVQHVRRQAGSTAGITIGRRVGGGGCRRAATRHHCECFRVVSRGGGGGVKRYLGRSVVGQLARRRSTASRCMDRKWLTILGEVGGRGYGGLRSGHSLWC